MNFDLDMAHNKEMYRECCRVPNLIYIARSFTSLRRGGEAAGGGFATYRNIIGLDP